MKQKIAVNIALLFLVLSMVSCSSNKDAGNNNTRYKHLFVEEFDEIIIQGSSDVVCAQSKVGQSYVRIDETTFYQIKERKLILKNNGRSTIYAESPFLSEVTLNGSGKIEMKDIKLGPVSASINGSGYIKMKGEAESGRLLINGSGNIDANGLKLQVANCKINGSGNIKVRVAQRLDAALNGTGSIKYKGSPKTVNKSGSKAYNIK
ncbi:GIN domain-containing protein [Dysgonomonas sp. 520]|uniref:GIN domain-containing protein n=1 Tax=Dysgonomonas sp. 520 TaxID=2302931 RepID=UPI0013D6E968|nr:DUF2807 domain-containing protein [Dysgonomonas sp. 520]NDW09511.1 hypothetical protein [Dysgonomonas sp. 520]